MQSNKKVKIENKKEVKYKNKKYKYIVRKY